LRAWHHAEALREAGHDVHLVTREQDAVPGGPPTFASTPELVEHARRVQPDVLLVVQPEEAPGLACLELPMAVDLYAPRMLEAQFQDAAGVEAVNTLRAIRAGDFFLFSNNRQRFYFLGLLALAGVDLRSHAFGAVVPLVAPQGPERKKPRGPLFVMGGVSWPWIDPTEALGRAVAHLDKRRRGKLLVLGHKPILGESPVRDLQAELPASKRLEFGGVLPYDQLLATYAGASAAIDMMAPTPERSMAVAFRHMDYLGCGLPMIVGDEHVLAESLREAGAGLVGLSVEDAIDAVLDEPDALAQRSHAARSLATGRFGRACCEAPLLAWLQAPTRRERRDTPLGELAEVSARAARSDLLERTAQADIVRLTAEVEAKRSEVAGLVQQGRVLSVATERLAGSVAEVAGFKREAIAVLGGAQARAQEQLSSLQARAAALEADLAKKGAELEAALREKGLHADGIQDLRRQLAGVDSRVQALRSERDASVEAREVAQADALKKTVELDTQARQQDLFRDQIASLERRLAAADKLAVSLRTQVAGAELGLAEALAESQKKSIELEARLRERQSITAHLETVQRQERGRHAEAVRLGAELGRMSADLAEHQRDGTKKTAELEAVQQVLDHTRAALVAEAASLLDARSDAAKKGAELDALRSELAQGKARAAGLGDTVDQLRARVVADASTLHDAQADAAKKAAELEGLQHTLEQLRPRAEADVLALKQALASTAHKAAELEVAQQTLDTLRSQADADRIALQDARSDAAKKGAEIDALQQVVAQERRAAESTQSELLDLRAVGARAIAEHSVAQQLLDQARGQLASLQQSSVDAVADAATKGAQVAALQRESEKLEGAVAAEQASALALQGKLELQAAELARADERSGGVLARMESLDASLADAQVDIEKKNNELEDAWSERERLEELISELRSRR